MSENRPTGGTPTATRAAEVGPSLPTGEGPSARRRLLIVAAIAAVVVAVDQSTKSLAQHYLRSGPVHVVGPLSLRLTYNSGVAFSIGQGHPAIVVGVAAGLVVLLLWAATRMAGTANTVAMGLLLGGALGNLSDRLFRPLGGAVVDFLSTGFWPTFNVADSCIVLGCALLVLGMLRR